MKKISVFIITVFAFSSFSARAGILDVSRLTEDGEFSASFGAAFKTGANKAGDAQDDISSGTVEELGLEIDYTFLEDWTLSFATGNDYSDSQIGLSYKILTNNGFKLDFSTNYGIAWTKDAKTDKRIGNNNIDAGFRIHGIAGDVFQWAAKITGQFVFAEPKNFWNAGLILEGMYYFSPDLATKVELKFAFKEIEQPVTLYDRAIKVGVVYNMSNNASVHPYLKYHFKTKNSDHSDILPDDVWEFGTEFSVMF